MKTARASRSTASLARYDNGYPFKPHEFVSEGVPVIRIKQLVDSAAEVDLHGGAIPARHHINDGDLIFSWSGSLNIAIWNRGFAYLNQHLFRVSPEPGVDKNWLRHALESALPQFAALMHGSAMTHVTQPMMKQVHVPTPVLAEQRRIADFLDDQVSRIDHILAARREQIARLMERKRAVTADLVLAATPSTIPLKRMIVDERPGVWGEEPNQNAPTTLVARVADFHREDFTLGPVPTGRSIPADQVADRQLAAGDVLLERSGGTHINPVGCPAFVAEVESSMVCSNFVSRLRPSEATNGRFLSLVLGALYWTRQQEPFSTQTTGIQNLNSPAYLARPVPYRSRSHQDELAVEADNLMAIAGRERLTLKRSVELLTEYKRSLITAAVTGEFDVTAASGRGAPV